jgi:predicted dehydrogenase
MKGVGVGLIGGGLMGREAASAFSRWIVLQNTTVKPELVAVCDISLDARRWFERIETCSHLVGDYHELLSLPDVEVVYVAVPHNLHEDVYTAVLRSGKDLFAEKPFGIDLSAAERILSAVRDSNSFVRCSSEFPYFPGGHAILAYASNGGFGRLLEVRAGFWHSSDLDPTKPANWKRQSTTCGEIGVMGDLGMHVLHIPLRLGWMPKRVYAQLQKGFSERPDGKGGVATCDTWDNAMLHCDIEVDGREVPMRLEMKRLAPGETNTWFIEILGTEGGIRFSTKNPKTLWRFEAKGQGWIQTDLGFSSAFPTITGGIFEAGFPDAFLQMWAAFLAEREGLLEARLGCATPSEAVASHRVFDAALESQRTRKAIEVS